MRHRPLAFESQPVLKPFLDAGCVSNQTSELDCKGAKAIVAFHCFRDVLSVAPELARIAPSLAYCSVPDAFDTADMPRSGCMIMHRRGVVAADAGAFTLLKNRAAVVARALPIDTREKALAVVEATLGVWPNDALFVPRGGHVLTNQLESGYVDWATKGFRVHAFYSDGCSCGPHVTNAVDAFISWSGEMKELANAQAFDDGDTSCVD